MKTFYRWVDGHTYWKKRDGWMGAPTFKDGAADVENASYIADFDLSAKQIEALETELDARNEGGAEGPATPQRPVRT